MPYDAAFRRPPFVTVFTNWGRESSKKERGNRKEPGGKLCAREKADWTWQASGGSGGVGDTSCQVHPFEPKCTPGEGRRAVTLVTHLARQQAKAKAN